MSKERCIGIDLLRGIAAFGIVGCHLSLSPRTVGGDLVTALCNFNVGVFAAVAGFLMCGGKLESGWLVYVRKRARRLLPTYFLWSLIFVLAIAAFDLLFDGGQLNPRYRTVGFWERVVLTGGSSPHLWFLICLFYVQVLLRPFLKIGGAKWKGMVWIVLGGLAIAASVVTDNWFGLYPLRLLAFVMTGYGLGCCYHARLLDFCVKRSQIVWCAAVGVLVAHVMARGLLPGFIKDWIAVGPVLLAFVGVGSRNVLMTKVSAILGATSMGVYLIHPLVTRGLSVIVARFAQSPYTAWVVLCDWVLAWMITFLTAFVLVRVPIVKRFI